MNKLTYVLSLCLVSLILTHCTPGPSTPEFSDIEAGATRKAAFFNYFLPIIEKQNQQILSNRKQLLHWYKDKNDLGWWDSRNLTDLAENYRISDFDKSNENHWQELLDRINIVPPSLVLAQSANESGWGTSRFAIEGNNYFGQWCYVKGCGLVPGKRLEDQKHEVSIFDSPEASVESYFYNLNTHQAYKSLRRIRSELNLSDQQITGVKLVAGLEKYSERGNEYIEEIRSMISYNGLTKYDSLAQ